MIFYAIAWREIRKQGIESRLSIPSGNYGNIAAAFLMHDIGLTFKEILAAHNANDTIPRFLSSGKYAPGKTVSTLANAMDIEIDSLTSVHNLFQIHKSWKVSAMPGITIITYWIRTQQQRGIC